MFILQNSNVDSPLPQVLSRLIGHQVVHEDLVYVGPSEIKELGVLQLVYRDALEKNPFSEILREAWSILIQRAGSASAAGQKQVLFYSPQALSERLLAEWQAIRQRSIAA